jgi:hypothetical protein
MTHLDYLATSSKCSSQREALLGVSCFSPVLHLFTLTFTYAITIKIKNIVPMNKNSQFRFNLIFNLHCYFIR